MNRIVIYTFATLLTVTSAKNAIGQELSIANEWQGFPSVNVHRDLPETVTYEPQIEVTRTGVVDCTTEAASELLQWPDDVKVEHGNGHLIAYAVPAMGFAPSALEVSAMNAEMQAIQQEAWNTKLEIRRQLTNGMWNWTLRQFHEQSAVLRSSGFHGFGIAGEAYTFGGIPFLR